MRMMLLEEKKSNNVLEKFKQDFFSYPLHCDTLKAS